MEDIFRQQAVPPLYVEQMCLADLPLLRHWQVVMKLGYIHSKHDVQEILAKSNANIILKYPPKQMAAQIVRRYKKEIASRIFKPKTNIFHNGWLFLCISICTLLLFLFMRQVVHREHWRGAWIGNDVPADNHNRSFVFMPAVPSRREVMPLPSRLDIFKNHYPKAVQLKSGDTVVEGDEVQVQYQTQRLFGVIFSVDGAGVVSLHYPSEAEGSTALAQGTHLLRFAFILDDAPGFEKFFMVASKKPVSVEQVTIAAKQVKSDNDSLLLPDDDFEIDEFVLHKIEVQDGYSQEVGFE